MKRVDALLLSISILGNLTSVFPFSAHPTTAISRGRASHLNVHTPPKSDTIDIANGGDEDEDPTTKVEDPNVVWSNEDNVEYIGSILCTMLKSSEFVYTYASIRKVVLKHSITLNENKSKESKLVEFYKPKWCRRLFERQGEGTYRLLKYPVEAHKFVEFLERNRKYLKQSEKGGPVTFNEKYVDVPDEEMPEFFPQLHVEGLLKVFNKFKGVLLDYDDQFTSSGGLVYGITKNRAKKRLTVVFRGTVGGPDVRTCANFFHNSEVFKCAGEDVKIHAGFATYLFNKIPGKGKSKFDRIVACIKEIYDDIPEEDREGYELYVTGHSLGGALSNIFSFAAASTEDHIIFQNMRCITFAAPVVGNRAYNRAFQKLERSGKLKYLRISNQGDVIPTSHVPGYTQNGVNMHLMGENVQMELKYRNTKPIASQISKDPLGDHSFPTYYKRLFQREIDIETPAEILSATEPNIEILKMTFDEVYKTGGDFTN